MPKVKTKKPPKVKTKRNLKASQTPPPFNSYSNYLWCTCLKGEEPQAYFLLFKEKAKVLRREIQRTEVVPSRFHIPLFHRNVIRNTELSLLLVAVFTQQAYCRRTNIFHN